MCVAWGTAIGYSHPNTLTDKSTMIKKGHRGDATVLQPTIMFCVPLILDRCSTKHQALCILHPAPFTMHFQDLQGRDGEYP